MTFWSVDIFLDHKTCDLNKVMSWVFHVLLLSMILICRMRSIHLHTVCLKKCALSCVNLRLLEVIELPVLWENKGEKSIPAVYADYYAVAMSFRTSFELPLHSNDSQKTMHGCDIQRYWYHCFQPYQASVNFQVMQTNTSY